MSPDQPAPSMMQSASEELEEEEEEEEAIRARPRRCDCWRLETRGVIVDERTSDRRSISQSGWRCCKEVDGSAKDGTELKTRGIKIGKEQRRVEMQHGPDVFGH